MARTTNRPKCVMLRLAKPLHAKLASAAAKDDRPLAAFIRRLLLDAAKRVDRRERRAAA
jgi:hypothetical protein